MNITLSNSCYEKTLTAAEFQFLSGCIKKTQWKVVYVQKKINRESFEYANNKCSWHF